MASAFTLRVECEGAKAGTGQAMFSLYSSEETFLKESSRSLVADIDSEGRAVFAIEDLEAGVYAVSVLHDVNGNGKVDTNFLGIPKEPLGMSNNAKGRFGPPKWKDSKFEFTGDLTIKIRIGNIRD